MDPVNSPASKRVSVVAIENARGRKRAKYTQVACIECKRRKLKCSGESLCSRCARDSVDCVYPTTAPTGESSPKHDRIPNHFHAVNDKMDALECEIRALSARVRALESTSTSTSTPTPAASLHAPSKSTVSTSAAGLDRILNPPKSPTYVGPTSAEFGLMPPRHSSDESDGDEVWTSDSLEEESRAQALLTSEGVSSTTDPLAVLGQAEALRLVQVYEDTVGIMYPCVDLESVRAYITDYYGPGRGAKNGREAGGLSGDSTEQEWFFARDIQVLKIILAIALLAESHGRSERAAQLADSVEDKFASRLKIPTVDMKELLILTMLSIFHAYRDDEVFAWRFIRMAMGGAMELGLHCQETWLKTGGVFPGELQWTWASKLWWCIYVLDRKWSFGTGLPFGIQDSDMDTNLPEPGASSPFLTCMISYARLGSKLWNLVVGWRSRPRAVTADSCAYLDFQVQQWIQSIPPDLRFDPDRQFSAGTREKDNAMTQQVLLALQANQLRILVYRQNLLSNDSIEANVAGASTAVETAKSTIHMLEYFSRFSPVYFQRPEPFNYFLISALAALFLAVLHAPTRFSHVCRPEFYTAVDLVRRSSTRARTSRRLQKIIRSLKLIRLNLRRSRRTPNSARPEKRQFDAIRHSTDSSNRTPDRSGSSLDHGRFFDPILEPALTSRQASHQSQPTPDPIRAQIAHRDPAFSTSPLAVSEMDSHSCEDLTSFFEMAGGYFLDPRGAGMASSTEESVLEPDAVRMDTTLDAFQAENEALTKVMAGLL